MATPTIITASDYPTWASYAKFLMPYEAPTRYAVALYSVTGNFVRYLPIYEADIVLAMNTWDTMRLVTDAKYVTNDSDQRLVLYKSNVVDRTIGILTTLLSETIEKQQGIAVINAVGGTKLLEHPIIDYSSKSTQANLSGAASDVMKQIVRDNLSNPTDTSRTIGRFQVQADAGYGGTYDANNSYEIVFNELLDINAFTRSQGAEVLFKVENVGTTPGDPLWEFKTYNGNTGVSKGIFTDEAGTFSGAKFVYDYSGEVTKVIVGGSGGGDKRKIRRVSNANRIAATPNNWRHIERFQYHQITSKNAELDAKGNEVLGSRKAKQRVDGYITEGPGLRFGKDWKLGNQVTIQAGDQSGGNEKISATAVVRAVNIMIREDENRLQAFVGADL